MEISIVNELKKLMNCFPGSYINHNLELILIPRTNSYFKIEDCECKRDIIAKILMWCSRAIAKGMPYRSEIRNNAFRELNKRSLNYYLGTFLSDEDIDLIYQRLGNGINPELTYKFIDSKFDIGVLNDR